MSDITSTVYNNMYKNNELTLGNDCVASLDYSVKDEPIFRVGDFEITKYHIRVGEVKLRIEEFESCLKYIIQEAIKNNPEDFI